MEAMVSHRPFDGSHVVSLYGSLDIDTAQQLRDVLDGLLDEPVPRIVLDLAGLTFCDSIGLSALAIAHRRCLESDGFLRLSAPTPFLQRVLAVVGLSSTLPAFRSVEAACAGDPAGLLVPARASRVQP